MREFLSERKLLRKLTQNTDNEVYQSTTRYPAQPFNTLMRSINKILDRVYPNGNCLVKSLVKRDLLKKHGYHQPIAVGVITSDQGIKAHAWLSGESETEYKIVHLL